MESTVRMLRSEIMIKWKDTLRVGVPAFAYVVQNQLLFLALSNLDAATYQVSHCSHPYTLLPQLLPGQSVTLPGQSVTLPGQSVTLPSQS